MPQRTNDFQHMVFLLQRALSDTSATIVTESAMLPNAVSENHEEIDVLISLKVGAEVFRTGICCRDHARRSSPDWIRNLAVQREHLGLDRIVAVTSAGISEPAENTAKKMGIEVVHFRNIEQADWLSLALPSTDSLFMGAVSTLVNHRTYVDLEVGSERIDEVRTLIVPGVGEVLADAFLDQVRSSAGQHAMTEYDPRKWKEWQRGRAKAPPLLIRVQVNFPLGTLFRGNRSVSVWCFVGYVSCQVEAVLPPRVARRRYNEVEAVMSAGETQVGLLRSVLSDGPQGLKWAGSINHQPLPAAPVVNGIEPKSLVCGLTPLTAVYLSVPPVEVDDILVESNQPKS